jgi:DNA polymerase
MWLVVDFETYYDDTYSLKNLTTQEYVYSDSFKIHGVGIALLDCLNDAPIEPAYIPWTCSDDFFKVIGELTANYPLVVVCHNTLFDGTILAKLGIRPELFVDTAAMSRAVLGNLLKSHSLNSVAEYLFGESKTDGLVHTKGMRELPSDLHTKLAEYCCKDVELTARITRELYKFMPQTEFIVSDLVTRMATEPALVIDKELIESYYQRVIERKKTALVRAGINDPKQLRSREAFANALRLLGVEPPTKISPTTGEVTYAFAKNDEGLKELMSHPNSDVQALVAAKLEASSTIEETRAAKFLRLAELGPLSIPYRFSGAVQTHRLSGSDGLNMQNLPRGGGLRAALRAPKGYTLVVSDLSQIELRVTLAMAGQTDALEVLRSGQDLYIWFAEKMYGRKIDPEVDAGKRQIAKSAVLGCGFGMGAARFADYCKTSGVHITSEDADAIVQNFRATFSRVPVLWKNLEQIFSEFKAGKFKSIPVEFGHAGYGNHYGFRLPCGLRVKYPNLRRGNNGLEFESSGAKEHLFGGKIAENLAQSLARNILFDKVLDIAKEVPAKLVMTTHDELVYVVENSVLDRAVLEIDRIMNSPVEWWPDVPLASKTKYAIYYGDVK